MDVITAKDIRYASDFVGPGNIPESFGRVCRALHANVDVSVMIGTLDGTTRPIALKSGQTYPYATTIVKNGEMSGDNTTQVTIIKSGADMTYEYVAGTDPGITTSSVLVGSYVYIGTGGANPISAVNSGFFLVTAVDAAGDKFTVENGRGIAEATVTVNGLVFGGIVPDNKVSIIF